MGVAGRLSGTVSPFRAEQGTSLETPWSRGTTRISGSLSCGAREVRSPCAWRGGTRHGTRVTGLEVRPSSVAPDPAESRGAPPPPQDPSPQGSPPSSSVWREDPGLLSRPCRKRRPSARPGVCNLCIGEGNGNPLQCSCLENPRDRGAWWAAVHGVTTSRTRLSDFAFTFHRELRAFFSCMAWRAIPGPLSKRKRRVDSLEAAQVPWASPCRASLILRLFLTAAAWFPARSLLRRRF